MTHITKILTVNKRVFFLLGFSLFFLFIVPEVVVAQNGLKISSLSEIESKTKEGTDSIKNMGLYAVGGVLAIALVYLIYAVATNQPHAKEFGLGWVIAVIFYLVATLII